MNKRNILFIGLMIGSIKRVAAIMFKRLVFHFIILPVFSLNQTGMYSIDLIFIIILREETQLMTRDEIRLELLRICTETFEFEDPGLDDDLREVHGFDSIDAIELLREIEIMLGTTLTREEKEKAMIIRTINQILDYIEALALTRT